MEFLTNRQNFGGPWFPVALITSMLWCDLTDSKQAAKYTNCVFVIPVTIYRDY